MRTCWMTLRAMKDSVLVPGVAALPSDGEADHLVGAPAAARSHVRLGSDVGSVSAKVVILDQQGQALFSAYRRHRTETAASPMPRQPVAADLSV